MAKIPTGEWLQSKFGRLIDMTEVVAKEYPGEYLEPEYGFWSIKKEIALMYWIWPFLKIAKEYFRAFYYIDLFAGSGLMKAGADFFVGSPIVAIGSTLPDSKFSQYICFDTDERRITALEKRTTIAAEYFGTGKPIILNEDCNEGIDRILAEYCPGEKACYLAFVDPQGITDLRWSTLQKLLTHCKGDLIINFPTSGVNRNLPNTDCLKALTEFFGDVGWREISGDIEAIVEYYKNKVALVRVDGRPRMVNSFPVLDENNRRLYDLIFATGSTGMKNALNDLKGRLESIRTTDIREIHRVIAGSQKQLTGY